MIRIELDPNLLAIGNYVVAWHGIFTFLAVVAALVMAVKLSPKAGLLKDDIYAVALWAIPGGIVGARLFHLIDYWEFYLANPTLILGFQGTSIYGAILGGAGAGALYARLKGLPVGRIADLVAPALLVAQIIGRIGCVINGDAYGSPTDLPWGLIYTHPKAFLPPNWIGTVSTHPTPVYEMIWDGIVLFAVWRLWRRLRPEGSLFVFYLTMYSFGRFFLTFLRQDRVIVAGLQEAHLISLLVLLIGVPYLAYRTSWVKAEAAPPAAEAEASPAQEGGTTPKPEDSSDASGRSS